jgi:hypothetical protein
MYLFYTQESQENVIDNALERDAINNFDAVAAVRALTISFFVMISKMVARTIFHMLEMPTMVLKNLKRRDITGMKITETTNPISMTLRKNLQIIYRTKMIKEKIKLYKKIRWN